MIDRALVHRSVEREVFVVDHERVDDTALRIDVCVPGFHPRVRQAGSELPMIVLLEIWRQSGFLVAHELTNVPVDWPFVTGRLSAAWASTPPVIPALGAIWCELVARVHTSAGRHDELHLEWRFDLSEDGQHVASGAARSIARSPAAYERWRALALGPRTLRPAPPEPAEPEGSAATWDSGDPFLADTTADRVSSLILAHVALAHSSAPASATRFDLECVAPAAHGRRVDLRLAPRPRGRGRATRYELSQDGTRIANARIVAPVLP
jgi:hypothetical protein